jgi:hypothetical protein
VDHKQLEEKRLNQFKCRWWTEELTMSKKKQNHLSSKSFKLCHVHDHPVHAEYKTAANKFKEVMCET